MRRVIVFIASLLLCSCAAVFDAKKPVPVRDYSLIQIQLTDELPRGVNGYADIGGGLCTVFLRKDSYPYCLKHEIRHCLEGNFHSYTQYSTEDC